MRRCFWLEDLLGTMVVLVCGVIGAFPFDLCFLAGGRRVRRSDTKISLGTYWSSKPRGKRRVQSHGCVTS